MKYVIVSDIHGSAYYAKRIRQIIEKEQADRLILLGDLYYHGPRNPLPQDYAPMEVAAILNGMKDSLLCIRGNCDAEVDEMISEFPFEDHLLLELDGRKVYFTHGHKKNMDRLPEEAVDMLFYGHFHTGFLKERNGILFGNPGSISLPKNGTAHSYILLEGGKVTLKDVDGTVIDEMGSTIH